jgi:hypothetical protein
VRKHSGMSPRPGYYAGRGPCTDDLNDQQLERLYTGLKTEVGDEAARNFVMMVEDLEDMSAAAFLWSFDALLGPQTVGRTSRQTADGVTVSGLRPGRSFAEAECLRAERTERPAQPLKSSERQSESIKRSFLMRHGVRPIKPGQRLR